MKQTSQRNPSVRQNSAQLSGFIALNKTENQEANEYGLVYVFDAGHHGQRYATESCQAIQDDAFPALHADRVTSGTALANTPSCRLLARLVLKKIAESTVSFHQTADGKPIVFAGGAFVITREDWADRHAASTSQRSCAS